MKSNIKIIVLHPSDNVGIVIADVQKEEIIQVNDVVIKIASDIEFGHKIALQHLSKRDKVMKYGVPIGITISEVSVGSHLHTHNMESLYMKQFTK